MHRIETRCTKLWRCRSCRLVECPVLDKVVDLPIVVQCVDTVVDVPVVQVLVLPQNSAVMHCSGQGCRFARYCASPGDGPDSADFVQFLDKSLTCPLLCNDRFLGFV